MGYKLRREVRDALPPGLLTAAERLLVLELADQCSDTTREGWPGAEVLAELADLSPRSIQEALSRIGKKWIELRVPLGKDASGRPYYSHAGRRTTFRFPPLARRKGAMNPGASEGATDTGSSGAEGATDPGGRCDGSVPKVRQIRAEGATDPGAFSSMNHSEPLISLPASPPADNSRSADLRPAGGRDEDSLEPEPQDARHRFVMRHGATADEAARVVADIQAEHRPRGNGWWRKVDQEGDLGDIVAQALARVRVTATELDGEPPVDVAGLIRQAERHGPHCEVHGVPGGKFLHPIHGTPLCAWCRRGLAARPAAQATAVEWRSPSAG